MHQCWCLERLLYCLGYPDIHLGCHSPPLPHGLPCKKSPDTGQVLVQEGTHHGAHVADISQPYPFMTRKGVHQASIHTRIHILTLPATAQRQTTFSIGLDPRKRWFQKGKKQKLQKYGAPCLDEPVLSGGGGGLV